MKKTTLLAVICLLAVEFCIVSASPTSHLTSGRIVNGQDAEPGSHPHQVTVQWSFSQLWFHMCGGSVIDELFVLTAAHCVDYAPAEDFRVIINDHRLYETDGNEQVIGVKRIYLHEDWLPSLDYDAKLFPNDLAILQLDTEVLDKTTIIPMASASDEDFAGVQCTISGWGLNGRNRVNRNPWPPQTYRPLSSVAAFPFGILSMSNSPCFPKAFELKLGFV